MEFGFLEFSRKLFTFFIIFSENATIYKWHVTDTFRAVDTDGGTGVLIRVRKNYSLLQLFSRKFFKFPNLAEFYEKCGQFKILPAFLLNFRRFFSTFSFLEHSRKIIESTKKSAKI